MTSLEEQILQEIQSKAITHAPDIAKAASKIALERIKEEVEKAWINGWETYYDLPGADREEIKAKYLKENGLL